MIFFSKFYSNQIHGGGAIHIITVEQYTYISVDNEDTSTKTTFITRIVFLGHVRYKTCLF